MSEDSRLQNDCDHRGGAGDVTILCDTAPASGASLGSGIVPEEAKVSEATFQVVGGSYIDGKNELRLMTYSKDGTLLSVTNPHTGEADGWEGWGVGQRHPWILDKFGPKL